jgi:hypothetical protein
MSYMRRISEKYGRLYHVLCWVLALHLLNYSIDPRDPHPNDVPEDLALNDIESFVEFVFEVVLGWEDAFDEFDEHDYEDGDWTDASKFFCSSRCQMPVEYPLYFVSTGGFPDVSRNAFPSPVNGIVVPPPETART